jgi:DNA-binding CsgD family transcriptional regulator
VPLLLQREAELAEFERGIRDAARGFGSVLLVQGPAGVGKSSLLKAARELAAVAGVSVFSAMGDELARAAAWAIARELLAPAVAALPSEAREQILTGPAAPAAALLGDGPVEEWSGPDQAFRLAYALTWVVAALGQRDSVALFVDDVHLADLASLRWLTFLAARVADLPVLVIAAARPVKEDGDPALARLSLKARILRPRPLDLHAVEKLIASRLGIRPAGEFTAACHGLTGGNPFLLHELLHEAASDELQPDGRAAEQLLAFRPESVARAVLLRLGRLDPPALELARAVAVLGDGAQVTMARALAGLSEADSLAAVDALTREDVFARDDRLRFVHPLVRSAVYNDLTPARRASAHRDAARLHAERGASHDAVVAQLLLAEPGGDPRAFEYLLDAAAQARRSGAPEPARELARRALAEPPPSDRRAQALEELGRAELAGGDPSGVEHLEAALDTARSEPERAEIARRLAVALILISRPRNATEILVAAHERIDAEMYPSLAAALQAELVGAALHDPATLAIAHEQLEAARAKASSPLDLEPEMLAPLAATEVRSAHNVGAGVAFAANALARRKFEPDGYSITLALAASALRWAGRLEQARRAWDTEVEDARRVCAPLRLSWSMASRAQVLLRLGQAAASEADARTAIELNDELLPHPVRAALAIHADALLETDDGSAARAAIARVTIDHDDRDLHPHADVLRVRARIRAEDHDYQGALSDLARIARLAQQYEVGYPDSMPWRAQAALVHAAAGDQAYGLRLAEEEAELAAKVGARLARAMALRALGLLRGERGLDDLREAVNVLHDSEDRLEYVRSLIDYGSALRRAGRRAVSRDPLREALDLAAAGGCTALVRRAHEELAASGARPRRDELRGRDALTPSERRVAVLASEGRTNREIAQALFVSLRTVETHLTHAYQKLDVRTRADLPAALEAKLVA